MAQAAGIIGIGARIGGLGEVLAGIGNINAEMLRLGNTAEQMAGGFRVATTGFQEFNNQVQNVQAAVGSVTTAVSTVTAPIRAIGDAVQEVAQTAGSASSEIIAHLGEIGSAASSIGTAGVAGIGALGASLVTGIGASIAVASRFQKELVDLRAITQATPEDIEGIRKAVLDLSSQFSESIPNIQRAALELAKAGVPAGQVAGVLDVALAFTQLSKGELDAQKAGEGLGALLQLFNQQFKESGQTVEEFSLRLGNNVTAVANNTRATIGEVLNAVNVLAPTLAARGQQVEDVFAALNVTLSAGIRGGEAGTGIRNLFNFLIGQSKEAEKVIKGLSLEEISPFDVNGNLRPALDVLRSIQEVFSKEGLAQRGLTQGQGEQALQAIFKTRAATAAELVRLLGDESIQKFFSAFGQTNVLDQARQQMQSLTRQLELLKNAAESAAISFGTPFLQPLQNLTTGITKQLNSPQVADSLKAAGQGIASVLSGSGQNDAFAGIQTNFGDDFAKSFAVAFNEVDALRAPVKGLLDDLGRLKDTVVGIVFPDDGIAQIEGISKALQTAVDYADRFVNFLNSNFPDLAQNFGSLVDEAGKFVAKIVDLATNGKGLDILPDVWRSLQPLIATARKEFDDVATAVAGLVGTIVENRDTIIGVFDALIVVLSKIDQLLINEARLATAFGSALANIRIPPQLTALFQLMSGNASAAVGTLVNGAGSPKPPTGQEFPAPNGLTGTPVGVANFIAKTQGDQADAQANFERLQAEAAARAGFAGSGLPGKTGSLTNTTSGATQPKPGELASAADAASKGFKEISGRIDELQEDAAKGTTQAFRELDKALDGIHQRLIDQLAGLKESFDDSFQQIISGAQKQRDELKESFNIGQEQDRLRLQLNLNQQLRRRDFDRELQDGQIARQHEREDQDVAFSRFQEDRTRIFKEGEDSVTRIRQRGIDDQNRDFQRGQERDLRTFTQGQEDQLRVITRGQEDRLKVITQSFENQDTTRLRARDDRERQAQLALDLSRATTPQDRTSIQQRFDDQTKLQTQQRKDQDEDQLLARKRDAELTATRRQQEDALLRDRRTQETDLIQFRQDQEDAAVIRRRNQELDDVLFRIAMEVRFRDFQRGLQDEERLRRRALDAQELLQRRQDEDKQFDFGQNQDQERRILERQLALDNLARAINKIDESEADSLNKLVEGNVRATDKAIRTAEREAGAAGASFNNRVENINDNVADKRTDLLRTRDRLQEALSKADPSGNSSETAAARAQLASINTLIDQAETVIRAQGILGDAASTSKIDSFNQSIKGLGSVDPATLTQLRGVISELNQLQTLTTTGGSEITVTTVLNSPQAERLAIAMENLTTKIDKIGPGTSIGEINVDATGATTPGDAVDNALQAVGGQ